MARTMFWQEKGYRADWNRDCKAGRYQGCPELKKTMLLFDSIKHRCETKGIPFELTAGWIRERLDKGVCEATGLPFDFRRDPENRRVNPFSPSVDRIDQKGGYAPENCRVVVAMFNMARNEWKDDELYAVAKAFCTEYEKTRTLN